MQLTLLETHMPTDPQTPEPDTPAQTCARCGCVSPLTTLFRKAGRAGILCPRCYVQYTEGQQRSLTFAAVGLVVLALLTRWAGLGLAFLLGSFVLVALAMVVSIVGHELAHALAGWLTGGQVVEFRLGGGPDLVTLRLGELWVRVRRYLAGGVCVVIYPPGRQQRWRTALLFSAGMFFHLLVIAACLPGALHADLDGPWMWRVALLIANVTLLISNLITRQALTQDGLVMADAAQLRQILTTPWDAAARRVASHTARAFLAWQRGDYAGTEAAALASMEAASRQPLVMNLHGIALLELGRPAEARAIFETLAGAEMEAELARLVPDADSQAAVRAMNCNNLAYAMLMAQAEGPDLQRARELAEAAFAVIPWEAGIEGTLGAALVETGAVEAGLRHLEAAGKQYNTPRSQASNLAWRALGQHRLGQSEQAQALLGEAARLDGTYPGLQLIHQKVNRMSNASTPSSLWPDFQETAGSTASRPLT